MTNVIKTRILPLPSKADDEQIWVERLLSVASRLDDAAFSGLSKATGLLGYARYVPLYPVITLFTSRGSSPYRAFVAFCEDNNVSLAGLAWKALTSRVVSLTKMSSSSKRD